MEAFHEGPDMLYINPETCIDCDACVPACPVEAIFSENDVPERYKSYTKLNADECQKYPTISEKKDPLPNALNIDQWKAKDKEKYGE